MDLFRLDLKTLEFEFDKPGSKLGEKVQKSVYFFDQEEAHREGKSWINQDVHHVYGVVKV